MTTTNNCDHSEEGSRRRHPAGKGVPESAEVTESLKDDEACELATSNFRPIVPVRKLGWMDVLYILGTVVAVWCLLRMAWDLGSIYGGL